MCITTTHITTIQNIFINFDKQIKVKGGDLSCWIGFVLNEEKTSNKQIVLDQVLKKTSQNIIAHNPINSNHVNLF